MFLSKKEIKISEQYLNHGYVIQNVDDIKSLDWIIKNLANLMLFPKVFTTNQKIGLI